jgi:hypothetical protein
MKTLKIFLAVTLFLNINNIGKCQTTISYYYDQGGNRIERIIQIPPPITPFSNENDQLNQEKTTSQIVYNEKIEEVNIKIYPNPTLGQLTVTLSNTSSNDSYYLQLFSLDGKLITQPTINNQTFTIDFSDKPKGTYILRINLNSKNSEWKVVKL